MERAQYQALAIGAGILAIILALVTGRLPRWLRVMLVVSLAVLASGAGVLVYRYFSTPTILTVAAGSLDGDAPRLLSTIAARMASTKSPVRLKVVDKGNTLDAVKAFTAGETDLVVARADAGDLADARTVVTLTHAVVLIVVPPGNSIDSMEDLKGKTIGVIGADINRPVVAAMTQQYDLDTLKVRFQDLTLKDAPQALQAKRVQALLVVLPITRKYLAMLRDLFPGNAKLKLGLVPIEAAGAIAAVAQAYESYELPKGTLRGSPPVPDDDLTTLRVPYYLLVHKTVDDDTVIALTKAMIESRRDLINEYPVLAQISSPSTDKDAFIPIHPGAAAYFDGDEKTIFDKYGDQFFYGSMLLGSLTPLFAAAWKFMSKDDTSPEARPLARLYALTDRIHQADDDAELASAERQIDDILKPELEKRAKSVDDTDDTAALTLAIQRLEHLIGQRRVALASRIAPSASNAPADSAGNATRAIGKS